MGHMLKIKCVDSRLNVHIFASKSVPFTLTTVQVPNLALTHTKRITVSAAGFSYTNRQYKNLQDLVICTSVQGEVL
jgi:hypothetical protein